MAMDFSFESRGKTSVIQRLLPPQTSLVSRRIFDYSDTSNVQIDQIFLRAP